MRRPVHEMLARAAGRHSGHMPGHKGRDPFGPCDLYALDTTELPTTDDLYAPEGALAEAECLWARAAGADASLLLHDGSTCGIHAMLQLWAREGDAVLLPRNAHLSAVQACVLGGLRPVWIPVTQRGDGSCLIHEEAVLAALREHPEARCLLLTRPDYFGCCLPLTRIAEEAHRLGIRLAVDEAHGAHFPWLSSPASAGACGADAWVQSVHKTLPGLTGSAVLHLRDAADAPAALRILRREQTSSPSFILMRSIDDSRAWMEAYGRERLAHVAARADALRRLLPSLGYRDAHVMWREDGLETDPTRLVIDAPQGGGRLAEQLAERGIDVELADRRRVVLILTAMTEDSDLDALIEALRSIAPVPREIPPLPALDRLPVCRMSPRAAVMAPSESVPLAHAAGRTAAAAVGLYPPGVPLAVPGELLTEPIIQTLQTAGSHARFGLEGDTIWCVRQ